MAMRVRQAGGADIVCVAHTPAVVVAATKTLGVEQGYKLPGVSCVINWHGTNYHRNGVIQFLPMRCGWVFFSKHQI